MCSDDPDSLPGFGPQHKLQMEAGFCAADKGNVLEIEFTNSGTSELNLLMRYNHLEDFVDMLRRNTHFVSK